MYLQHLLAVLELLTLQGVRKNIPYLSMLITWPVRITARSVMSQMKQQHLTIYVSQARIIFLTTGRDMSKNLQILNFGCGRFRERICCDGCNSSK